VLALRPVLEALRDLALQVVGQLLRSPPPRRPYRQAREAPAPPPAARLHPLRTPPRTSTPPPHKHPRGPAPNSLPHRRVTTGALAAGDGGRAAGGGELRQRGAVKAPAGSGSLRPCSRKYAAATRSAAR
jgi:hypothetical protein